MALFLRRLLIGFFISIPAMTCLAGDAPNTVVVTRGPLTETLVLDGIVEAVDRSTISAQTSGRILEISFDVGDTFTAGTLILQLEDSEQRAGWNQAQASLDEAAANLVDARQRFERIRAVRNRDLASEQAFDQATNRLEAAKARRERSIARVSEAEQQLAYTQVRAKSDGIFTRRHVEPGEAVRPGQPLFDVLALSPLRVEAALPRRYLSQVRDNPRIHVSVDEGQMLNTGALTIYPQADPRSDTVRLRLRLLAPGTGILPGMLAKVAVGVASRDALWIPVDSLIQRSELRAVYVLDENDQPRLRQVRIGIEKDERLEVLSGLDAGERVLIEPRIHP
ncbi:efflux RND transporter periplasmic adaptor subunit [Vreelandella massiliensis]|uniref:efflux RND transporter periplasmic adaptor subunit n=1 Tax=Vreelandella massiliensis TaxID=1816686 RepID=UPI00096A5947|nr:efflux RND transporter periplasmic adaptor subunit [Halomonas massiliensis]